MNVFVNLAALTVFEGRQPRQQVAQSDAALLRCVGAPRRRCVVIQGHDYAVRTIPFAHLAVELLALRAAEFTFFSNTNAATLAATLEAFDWGDKPRTTVADNPSQTEPRTFETFGGNSIRLSERTIIIDHDASAWHPLLRSQVIVIDRSNGLGALCAVGWACRVAGVFDAARAHDESPHVSVACAFARHSLFHGVTLLIPDAAPERELLALVVGQHGGRVVDERQARRVAVTHVVSSPDDDGSRPRFSDLLLTGASVRASAPQRTATVGSPHHAQPAAAAAAMLVDGAWALACAEVGLALPPHYFFPRGVDAVWCARRPMTPMTTLASSARSLMTLFGLGRTSAMLPVDPHAAAYEARVLAGSIIARIVVPPSRAAHWLPHETLRRLLLACNVLREVGTTVASTVASAAETPEHNRAIMASVLDYSAQPSNSNTNASGGRGAAPVGVVPAPLRPTASDFVLANDGSLIAIADDVALLPPSRRFTADEQQRRRAWQLNEYYHRDESTQKPDPNCDEGNTDCGAQVQPSVLSFGTQTTTTTVAPSNVPQTSASQNPSADAAAGGFRALPAGSVVAPPPVGASPASPAAASSAARPPCDGTVVLVKGMSGAHSRDWITGALRTIVPGLDSSKITRLMRLDGASALVELSDTVKGRMLLTLGSSMLHGVRLTFEPAVWPKDEAPPPSPVPAATIPVLLATGPRMSIRDANDHLARFNIPESALNRDNYNSIVEFLARLNATSPPDANNLTRAILAVDEHFFTPAMWDTRQKKYA